MTSSHHGSYELGYTRATMGLLRVGLHTCYNGAYKGERSCEAERILKKRLSSDCTLQLEYMKLESLVIADQHAAVNTFPGLVHTARHAMGVCSA